MLTEAEAISVTSVVAAVSTVLLFGTGIPVCWRIVRKGTTTDVSFFPFVVMFCNATLWFKYGLLKHDNTVTYVNGMGALLTLVYTIIYYFYATNKLLIHKQLAFGGTLLFPILLYLRYYATDRDDALFYMGIFCSSVGVLSYGSPLAAMTEVMRTKSTSSMTFSLSFGNFIVAIEWVLYGYLVGDLYIQVPNFLGFILGVFQLSLFAMYPPRPMTGPEHKI